MQDLVRLPIIVIKDTAVQTTIMTAEIPARIQFSTIVTGASTLCIMILCRIGGRTIPTSTKEKLPSGVKSLKRKDKDIETKKIAKERDKCGDHRNQK